MFNIKKYNEINKFLKKTSNSGKIVAISKNHPVESILEAINCGVYVFGENRVQEAKNKFIEIKQNYPNIELHLTGPLQSNKVKSAIKLFDVFHTIDREKIAKIVSSEMKKQNKRLNCFIQVNIGYEKQKSGIDPKDAIEFANMCVNDYDLSILGFMCIPPAHEDSSPYFGFLNKLASRAGFKSLSMGMSSDFEDAIRLGATHVRVGSAIFGERTVKK